jgi:hypothetical protein
MSKGIIFDETEEARKLASVYMEIADGKGGITLLPVSTCNCSISI